jgi:RNA recognition motif-containing protein
MAQTQIQTQGSSDDYNNAAPVGKFDVPPKTWNIFVGDISNDVTEEDLATVFSECGEIHTINIIRDRVTGHTKGYAFVHFRTKEAQQTALQPKYNGIVIKGRPIRVRASDQKTVLFVGNLPMDMNESEVTETLKRICAPVTQHLQAELKVGPPPMRKSRGFCFVTFPSHELADACKKILSSSTVRGRQLHVSWAETNNKIEDEEVMAKVTTLFVSNLPVTVDDDILHGLMLQFGDIVKSIIVKDPRTGESRGFAFVEFREREACLHALKHLDGIEFQGQKLSIVLAKPSQTTEKKSTHRASGIAHRTDSGVFVGRSRGGNTSGRFASRGTARGGRTGGGGRGSRGGRCGGGGGGDGGGSSSSRAGGSSGNSAAVSNSSGGVGMVGAPSSNAVAGVFPGNLAVGGLPAVSGIAPSGAYVTSPTGYSNGPVVQAVQPPAAMAQPIAFVPGAGGTTYAYVLSAPLMPGTQGLAQPLPATQPMLSTVPTDPSAAPAQIQYIAYDPNQQYAGYAYIAPQPFPTPTSGGTATNPSTTTPSTAAATATQQTNLATNRYTPY